MGKYTVIADIGKGILNMLRDKLVPEPVDKSEFIGICEPRERGNYIVGIHPYDIKEDTSGQNQESAVQIDGSMQDPPAMIELYYMVSVSSKAELENKALEEAKIIGKVIQVFKDNPVISTRYMSSSAEAIAENVPISMLPIEMEEKVKVWTMFGESYKLSVFYVVGPIAIDSEKIRKPRRRVENILVNASQIIPKKIVQFETNIKEEEIDDEYTYKPEEPEEGESGEDSEDSESNDESEESDESSEESDDDSESNDESEESDESSEESDDDSESNDESEESDESSEESGDDFESDDESEESDESSEESGDDSESDDSSDDDDSDD